MAAAARQPSRRLGRVASAAVVLLVVVCNNNGIASVHEAATSGRLMREAAGRSGKRMIWPRRYKKVRIRTKEDEVPQDGEHTEEEFAPKIRAIEAAEREHSLRSQAGNERTVITFGQHSGLTFGAVQRRHLEYCEWVLSLSEPSRRMAKLQMFLIEARRILSGKHKGQTFDSVLSSDPAYCQYLIARDRGSLRPSLQSFHSFLTERLAQDDQAKTVTSMCRHQHGSKDRQQAWEQRGSALYLTDGNRKDGVHAVAAAEFDMITWNVCGLAVKDLPKLCSLLKHPCKQLTLLALQEISAAHLGRDKWQRVVFEGGDTLFHGGLDLHRSSGILLPAILVDCVSSVRAWERGVAVYCTLFGRKVAIVSAHMPRTGLRHPEEEYTEALHQLEALLPCGEALLIAGDFNVQLGLFAGSQTVGGGCVRFLSREPYAEEEIRRATALVRLLSSRNVTALSTFRDEPLVTLRAWSRKDWTTGVGKTVDYVAGSKEFKHISTAIQDQNITVTDHKMIRSTLSIDVGDIFANKRQLVSCCGHL